MQFRYLAFILALVTFISCDNKPPRPGAILTPEQVQQMNQQTSAAVAGAVKHYICPNNCAGSGGEGEGSCPVCGSPYIHNQAYHDQAVQSTTQTLPQSGATDPAQNAAGVWHYTCPNGHAGGAGGASACPECGAQLVHNQSYHDGAAGAATTPVPTTPQSTEPPQNAAGVWHYTCPKGCAGGAGAAVACAKCGSQLAHNQLYHQ